MLCADNSLYTGVTVDVERRLNEHNSNNGKAAKYTRHRQPVKLAYQEPCLNRSDACKREWAIKKLSRAQKLQLIESNKLVEGLAKPNTNQ